MDASERTNTHTPGPWKWDEGWGAILSCGDVQRLVCPVWTGGNRSGMTESEVARDVANARLIAAAPDLLEALEDLIERAGTSMHQANSDGAEYDVDDELKAAYAAIAKARGR